MKQRKMRKKDYKAKISVLTGMLMLVTLVLLFSAVYTSINNRVGFLRAKNAFVVEMSNRLNISVDKKISIACNVVSTGVMDNKARVEVSVDSLDLGIITEYRYYIKEATKDMYVLEEISEKPTYEYLNLKQGTPYDIKVVAVKYYDSNNTVFATTYVKTPSIGR